MHWRSWQKTAGEDYWFFNSKVWRKGSKKTLSVLKERLKIRLNFLARQHPAMRRCWCGMCSNNWQAMWNKWQFAAYRAGGRSESAAIRRGPLSIWPRSVNELNPGCLEFILLNYKIQIILSRPFLLSTSGHIFAEDRIADGRSKKLLTWRPKSEKTYRNGKTQWSFREYYPNGKFVKCRELSWRPDQRCHEIVLRGWVFVLWEELQQWPAARHIQGIFIPNEDR